MARKPEWPSGKIDVVGSTVDLGHLLNGHDGRLYPRGVHRLLARVLAPCTVHGDFYRRQEARVGRYDMPKSITMPPCCALCHIVQATRKSYMLAHHLERHEASFVKGLPPLDFH